MSILLIAELAKAAGVPVDLIDWLPDSNMVARVLRGRTRANAAGGGRLEGIFTDTTEPTATQVQQIIADAGAEVATALPNPLPDAPGDDKDTFRKSYQALVARLAAADVEQGYPSTRGGDRYDRLYQRYKDAKAILVEAVGDVAGGSGLSVESDTGTGPLSSFGDDCLVGPRTVY